MNLHERTSALLAVVDEYRSRRCAELIDPAQQQASAIRREALRAARSRVRTAIAEARARIASEIGAAEARLATERRLLAQRRAAATLAQARAPLRAALRTRWQAPETRARWIESHLARALRTLPPAEWEIQHPPDWPGAERAATAARLQAQGIRTRFVASSAIDAGLRVIAGHNALDFTLAGLLAERAAIDGRLLQLLSEAR